jgi:uncharacterized protein (TIGR03435 family)
MRARDSFLILWLAFFCFAAAVQADTGVKVGSPAPPLSTNVVLQAPNGVRATWKELKGEAVVIEFWATWCGGCVDNIPHINELAEQFASRPLQFISMTDESDIDLVERFLLSHPIRGWVALDANESTFKSYGIEGRPQTVLVDRDGVVRAITNPTSVTAQVLEDLLANRPLDFPEPRMGPVLGFEPNAPLPLLQVLIRPAAPVVVSGTAPGGVFETNGRYDAYGETLRDMLSQAYQIPASRVDAPAWCSIARYDFSVVTPQHESGLRWLLIKQALDATFRLKLHEDMKETPVYVLRKLDGQQAKLRLTALQGKSSHWNHEKGEFESIGAPVRSLTIVAQRVLGGEVLDETGLTERYDFDVKWNPNEPSSLLAAIRAQLGLALVLEHRKMEHLVVDSIDEAQTW